MKTTVVFSSVIVLFSIVAIVFIQNANDHSECGTKTKTTFGNNGESIVSEVHVCKENYNI